MKILALQHARVEHPGKFRTFLAEDGHTWDAIELDEGEALPANTDGYDALWVLGGPMDTWQEQEYPWLRAEKEFIRQAVVEEGKPYFGLCLGHQLLAEAVGGSVGPSDTPEIGVLDVQLTEEGAGSVFLDNLPEVFAALQWHSAEVKTLPAGCKVLATSEACAVQAFAWGNRAHCVQFHLEVEKDTVANWAAIAQYAEALNNALGEGAVQQMTDWANSNLAKFEQMAERVYINWMQTAAQAC